jgi:ribosomal protein S18
MNKTDGGKQRKQKDTVIPQSNPTIAQRGKPQKMTNSRGEAKGLESVLKERGYDVEKFKRAKCKPVCPFESKGCCMARELSQQDDFMNQPSMLETLITEKGHLCLFLPKFHCELNPIEMYWGWCKYRYRQTSKKNFQEAKDQALEYLDACPTEVIRRFIQRSWRFMSAYRMGLTGKAAAWAVRKQKSHRACNQTILAEIDKIPGLK